MPLVFLCPGIVSVSERESDDMKMVRTLDFSLIERVLGISKQRNEMFLQDFRRKPCLLHRELKRLP